MQKAVWKNAGLSILRNNPKLSDVRPRLDPTVIRQTDSGPSEQAKVFQDLLVEDWTSRRAKGKSYTSVLDYHEAYKSGALSPIDVVDALLPLIRKDVSNPSRHTTAFLETRVDLVQKAAAASAERYKRGKPISPLDGIPVAVKDEVDLKGYRRCLGSKLDFTNPADVTTVCIENWESAGAVIMGKLNMHEVRQT